MKNKEDDKPIIETLWYKIFVAVLFISIFYYAAYNTLQKTITIWSRPRYTVAKLIGISKNFRSAHHDIKYEYYEKNERLEDFLGLPKKTIDKLNINYNGGKYLLVYDSLGISGSEVLYECGELPDTIVAPINGWVYPPIPWCDKRYQLYDSTVWYNWVLCKTLDVLNIKVKPKQR